MNSSNILQFVDLAPSTTKEVFSSITGSTSATTKRAAITATIEMARKINQTVALSPDEYIKVESVENFMAFADEVSFNETKTLKYRLTVSPFKPLWIRLLALIFDLNYQNVKKLQQESSNQYFEIGDGIVLAGLYLALKEE